ncbi:response regulator [Herbiconiux sp. VKM Ac-1786]|uniref:response regulator n=1 Tax=Herbiconiux sp. VKM Ac-1786 TaxID=2783824 RepID=UPI00188C4466|nr:response regulator [Herbiconiux sp. VKM Ac-1786]MBF4571256.1 response regulator [Herbiconiux sp. VKM Ac-1786]
MSPDRFDVLLVEDNADSRRAAEADIADMMPDAVVHWAGDTQSALELMAANVYDLAVCDLRIPAKPRDLSLSETNGLAVVAKLRESQPGTPVIILSAFGTIEDTEPYTSGASPAAAHGVPALRMCQAVVKGVEGEFTNRLRPIQEGQLKIVGLEFTAPTDLDLLLRRAISQFAVDRGMTEVEVTRAGGLSGSTNAIVTMRRLGAPEMRAFVKADAREWVLDELERRRLWVEGYLDASNWAPTIETLSAGLRDRAAYFSSLASNPTTLFDLAAVDDGAGSSVISKLQLTLVPWNVGDTSSVTVADLRRAHLSDAELISAGASVDEFSDVESLTLDMRSRVCHGDLHGENVLVVDGGRPMMVDFAYTGNGPAGEDPITLEMSLMFHPGSPLVARGSSFDYERWADGDYLPNGELRETRARCREWGVREAGREQFMAVSYAHAIRHLKRGVPAPVALAVARSAADALR